MQQKLFAILSYFSILVFIPFFLKKNDKFIMYHVKQGLVLLIFTICFAILSIMPKIGGLILSLGVIFQIIFISIGIFRIVKHQQKPLPFIGRYGEELHL